MIVARSRDAILNIYCPGFWSSTFFSRRSGTQPPDIQVGTPMRGRMTAWSRIQMPTPSSSNRFSMKQSFL